MGRLHPGAMRRLAGGLAALLLATAPAVAGPAPKPASADAQARAAAARIVKRLQQLGFTVRTRPFRAGPLGWAPDLDGQAIVAEDPRRNLARFTPYASPPASPELVHPQVTLYVFPLARLAAEQSLVARTQPALPAGALPGALLLTWPGPQSGDQDDGKTTDRIMRDLFPQGRDKPRPAPAAVLAFSPGATLWRGLLSLQQAINPAALAKPEPWPAGVAAAWSQDHQGAMVKHLILPAPARR